MDVCIFLRLSSLSPTLNSIPSPQVYPKQGPLKGGTLLTVEGENLSIRFSDVKNMTVAGEPCVIEESGYRVSTRSV